MSHWPPQPFNTIYAESSRNGITRPKATRGSGYKMVNMGELFAYGRFLNPDMERVQLSDSEIERFSLKQGDLLFARQSLVLEGIGKCSIVMHVPETTCFESHLIRVRLDKQKVVPAFYYYYFGSYQGKANIQSLVMQVAAAGIRGSELALLQLPVPPLSTQRKIAAILSAYDDLIENNLRRIKILEEMAQNLYREWFVKFRFPGHQHARFTDSPLGRIPEGWEVKRLDQVVLFQNNGTEAGEHLSDRVYLPIDCIPRKSLAISEVSSWKEAQSSLHLFDVGDILFGAMRPYFHKVVAAPFKGVTRKTCFVFKNVYPDYYAFAVLTLFQDSTVLFANAHSKGATIPYAVWPQSMDGMPVVVPPIEQAKKFEEAVSPMISRIGTMYFQNTALRRTRDLLLPRLISGEVDVSELDIAVPEEVCA